jgi:hypothetical protein
MSVLHVSIFYLGTDKTTVIPKLGISVVYEWSDPKGE